MNDKGLYTSVIGILVLLLIIANLYVFLGTGDTEGSTISNDVRYVQKAWYKTSFMIDAAHNDAIYEYLKTPATCGSASLGIGYPAIETAKINNALSKINSGNLQCEITLCGSKNCINTPLRCIKYAPNGIDEQIVYEKLFSVDKEFASEFDTLNPSNCLVEIKDIQGSYITPSGSQQWCVIDEIDDPDKCDNV